MNTVVFQAELSIKEIQQNKILVCAFEFLLYAPKLNWIHCQCIKYGHNLYVDPNSRHCFPRQYLIFGIFLFEKRALLKSHSGAKFLCIFYSRLKSNLFTITFVLRRLFIICCGLFFPHNILKAYSLPRKKVRQRERDFLIKHSTTTIASCCLIAELMFRAWDTWYHDTTTLNPRAMLESWPQLAQENLDKSYFVTFLCANFANIQCFELLYSRNDNKTKKKHCSGNNLFFN